MNVSEQILWEPGIYQLEETDLVLGGPSGIANQQAKQLANRTLWLKDELYKMGQFMDVLSLTGDTALDKTKRCFLFVLSKDNGTLNIQLPSLADVKKGSIYPFVTNVIKGVPAKLICAGNDRFILNNAATPQIYLHSIESLFLVADAGFWQLLSCSGNLLNVGNPFYGYKVQPNTLIRNGQLVSRAEYPRLWEWVQTLGAETLLDDWLWNFAIDYQGCFSRGDGQTNFRLPDDRAMFERALDLGRGIDLDRPYNYPGGYEKDELKEHDHTFNPNDVKGRSDNANDRDVMLPGGQNLRTGKTGGRETRPMNIGKIPLISY